MRVAACSETAEFNVVVVLGADHVCCVGGLTQITTGRLDDGRLRRFGDEYLPLYMHSTVCINSDVCVRFGQIAISAVCTVALREEVGNLFFEHARRGLAGLRTRELILLSGRLRTFGA